MAPKRGPPLTTPSKCFPISIATQTSSARQSCRLELRRAAPDLIPRMCLPCNRLRVSSRRLARRTSGSFPGPNIRVLTRGSPGHSRLPLKGVGKLPSFAHLFLPRIILCEIIIRLGEARIDTNGLLKLRECKVLFFEPPINPPKRAVGCGVVRGQFIRRLKHSQGFLGPAFTAEHLAKPVAVNFVLGSQLNSLAVGRDGFRMVAKARIVISQEVVGLVGFRLQRNRASVQGQRPSQIIQVVTTDAERQ